MIDIIISGGQTGVDRAALDVAMANGIACGGSCPAGRDADDGPIPARYPLIETAEHDHMVRTGNNVRDADATLLLYRDKLHGGTAYAVEMARHMDKPVLAIDLDDLPDAAAVADWVKSLDIHILHIGGQREKTSPGIYQQASEFIQAVVDRLRD
jgi:hypothetical protein